ncbi:unnamed protein product [Eruca vesicaria subsp. sativa]|uniref:Uncharacterized protein n=1 Tax=Eruca vesicaria subsp. sativa TaxID=29727 RepID=A0ABC8LAY8_ERUVS|nr:unnamed protein product [Eruca vesicaria subsp. sativa]
MNATTSQNLEALVYNDVPVNVYIWDMDEILILLRSLLNGTYAEFFNGSKDVKRGVEIGVDFKMKQLTVGDKRLKLTIWDTVYDVTRRETFTNLVDVWSKEIELYSTNQDCVTMLVGNKVDRESERGVSREEGIALAKEVKCMFLDFSARTRKNVEQCFE